MMLSDVYLCVCLSVAFIGPKSRTERPRKTKICTMVAHVTRDLDTTFTVKRSKVTRPLWLAVQVTTLPIVAASRLKFVCSETTIVIAVKE